MVLHKTRRHPPVLMFMPVMARYSSGAAILYDAILRVLATCRGSWYLGLLWWC